MMLEKILCETCGGRLELINDANSEAKCVICGNIYFIKDAEPPGKKTDEKPKTNQPSKDDINRMFFDLCVKNKLADAKKGDIKL